MIGGEAPYIIGGVAPYSMNIKMEMGIKIRYIYTWGISIETNMYMDVTQGYKYSGLEYWCENCIELQLIWLFIGPR